MRNLYLYLLVTILGLSCNMHFADFANDQTIINNNEKDKYEDNKYDEKCFVCLDKMGHNDEIIKLKCGHKNHLKCILPIVKQGIQKQNFPSCPSCGKKIGKKNFLLVTGTLDSAPLLEIQINDLLFKSWFQYIYSKAMTTDQKICLVEKLYRAYHEVLGIKKPPNNVQKAFKEVRSNTGSYSIESLIEDFWDITYNQKNNNNTLINCNNINTDSKKDDENFFQYAQLLIEQRNSPVNLYDLEKEQIRKKFEESIQPQHSIINTFYCGCLLSMLYSSNNNNDDNYVSYDNFDPSVHNCNEQEDKEINNQKFTNKQFNDVRNEQDKKYKKVLEEQQLVNNDIEEVVNDGDQKQQKLSEKEKIVKFWEELQKDKDNEKKYNEIFKSLNEQKIKKSKLKPLKNKNKPKDSLRYNSIQDILDDIGKNNNCEFAIQAKEKLICQLTWKYSHFYKEYATLKIKVLQIDEEIYPA